MSYKKSYISMTCLENVLSNSKMLSSTDMTQHEDSSRWREVAWSLRSVNVSYLWAASGETVQSFGTPAPTCQLFLPRREVTHSHPTWLISANILPTGLKTRLPPPQCFPFGSLRSVTALCLLWPF